MIGCLFVLAFNVSSCSYFIVFCLLFRHCCVCFGVGCLVFVSFVGDFSNF